MYEGDLHHYISRLICGIDLWFQNYFGENSIKVNILSLQNERQQRMKPWFTISPALQWRHMILTACKITKNSIVLSTCCSGTHQRKHQSSATGPSWGEPPVTDGFPHKGPVTQKIFYVMTSSWFQCALLAWYQSGWNVTACCVTMGGCGVTAKPAPEHQVPALPVY